MSASIGAALRAGREQRHLTLAQVSEATRVRIHYLQALENDDLSAMPSAAQGRGFMRIYAQFLELDLEALIPPAAPAIATAPEAPTSPANGAASEASRPSPESGSASTIPSILTGLRENLKRRLRPNSPAPTDEGPATASGADAPDKKKVPS
ncbi:MAG TPA: helix-turn-helix transcriptional regulator [Anaerolineales bacterium]|nr:helix-turn-helix transcriptional regulator [Anaerolineales bacterium]